MWDCSLQGDIQRLKAALRCAPLRRYRPEEPEVLPVEEPDREDGVDVDVPVLVPGSHGDPASPGDSELPLLPFDEPLLLFRAFVPSRVTEPLPLVDDDPLCPLVDVRPEPLPDPLLPALAEASGVHGVWLPLVPIPPCDEELPSDDDPCDPCDPCCCELPSDEAPVVELPCDEPCEEPPFVEPCPDPVHPPTASAAAKANALIIAICRFIALLLVVAITQPSLTTSANADRMPFAETQRTSGPRRNRVRVSNQRPKVDVYLQLIPAD